MKTSTFLLGLITLLSSQLALANRIETYTGEAKKDGKLVYTEKHVVNYDQAGNVQDAETTYRNPNGEVIAVLKSDFRTSLTAPDHVITNMRTGNVQGLRSANDKLVLFNKDKGKTEESKELDKKFDDERVAFGCQGLNYYLLKNLDSFKEKKTVPIKFLIPGNLDYYDFEIEYIRELENGIVEIEIEIDNWFLRLFAPKLKIKYDKTKQRIVWYEGLSNIKDDDGKNQNVTINYTYDTP